MNKIVLLALTLIGSFQLAYAETNNDITFKQVQNVQLNCKGFGELTASEYQYDEEFSFIRLVDDKKNTYYLPFIGGNTAYLYGDTVSGLTFSTDHGDLSKKSFLDKKEWSDQGKENILSYDCVPLKKKK